ncbi:Mu transposase domain-containing protein [Streptomyces sp. NPDC086782]|uniref:Mu transposase domain-containing protein n=1 Tax=Streptomyces sp. NPDC086782 TaxID=3365757 RepID=UPI003823E0B3
MFYGVQVAICPPRGKKPQGRGGEGQPLGGATLVAHGPRRSQRHAGPVWRRQARRPDGRAAPQRRRRQGDLPDLATAEQLLELPTLPFPAELDVVRTVSPQALVSFEGNLYSVSPGMSGIRVTVRQRLGEDYPHIATAGKAAVARHRLASRGAGRTVRDEGHVIALERAVLAQVSDRAPSKTKTPRPLSPEALAEAERLRGQAVGGSPAERVVINLDTYAAVADRLRTAPTPEEEPGE